MITIKSNNIFAVDIGGSKLICGFVTAGEIGHFIVEEANGEECGCGNFGCLEAMASGASVSKIYNRATNQNLTTKEIAELAKSGDKNALEVFEKAGFYIGKAIATSVNLLGLNKVVLGGGVSENFDLLIPFIEKSFNRFVFKKANPFSVMTSYNMLNGIYTSANYELLTEILRNEWGYEGWVMTDWGVYDYCSAIECVKAGSDTLMPGCYISYEELKNAGIERKTMEKRAKNLITLLAKTN